MSRALEADLCIDKVVCWTDPQITLAWIKSINKEFDPFVENRVVEIRKNVDVDNWHYVNTNDNPADLITRSGNSINSMWFSGPTFLYEPSIEVEKEINCEATSSLEYLKELRKTNSILLVSQEKSRVIGNVIDIMII